MKVKWWLTVGRLSAKWLFWLRFWQRVSTLVFSTFFTKVLNDSDRHLRDADTDFAYTYAKSQLLQAGINLTGDIRVALVMTNTTADTEKDVNTVSAFGTLDECDGANYVRKALANEAVTEDEANDRGEFDADNVTWTALGSGTRQVQGAIVYLHVIDDTDSVPIAWIDTGGFPFDGGGADITIQWNAEGIIQAS